VIRILRCMILLLTWVGLSVRAADLPMSNHEAHHEICDHSHDHSHDHDDGAPFHDHHHHCHCQPLQPLFCSPQSPLMASLLILLVSSTKVERSQWGLPDDPVYAPEVPPIIS
jgi:hypothetical protein